MSTGPPEIFTSRMHLPPPFRSGGRIHWMNSNSSNFTPSSHNITTNILFQEHRVGFHPLVGSGTKSQIISSSNRTYTQYMVPSAKVPVVTLPGLPVVNSLVAIYLIIVIIVSVVANSIVMIVAANKRSRGRSKSNHICTLCLAIADSLFSLLIHSVMAAASLGIVDIEKIFNGQGCSYYGVGAMFFGTFSMCIHASVSFIRYLNICHPEKVEWLDMKFVVLLILGSLLYAGAWALGPALEWGRYDNFEFGCTIAFTSKSKRARLFIAIIFICILLFPLGMLITSYALIVVQAFRFQKELGQFTNLDSNAETKQRLSTRNASLMHSLKRKQPERESKKVKSDEDQESEKQEGHNQTNEEKNEEANKRENREESENDKEETKKKRETEQDKEENILSEFIFDKGSVKRTQRSLRMQAKLIRMSMVVAGGYILAWMPYATVCVWVSYGNASLMPEGFRIGASLFCKSATAYNPFIYFFMSESFRKDVKKLCGKKKRTFKTSSSGTFVPQVSVSRISSQPPSIRSLEVSSLRSRSIRTDSFCHRVPSIRRTSTSTLGSPESSNSVDMTRRDHPSTDENPPIRISPCPERRRLSRLPSPLSPSAIHRMQSLPHNSNSLHTRSMNVRRLSSTPYREETSNEALSRRSSLSFNPDPITKSNSFNRSGKISSSSLRLPPTQSPKLDRRRGKALSQSFRSSTSTTKVTVHRRDSWMDDRNEMRRPKSTREIQKDLESIISNEFQGNLRLNSSSYDIHREEKIEQPRRKSLRSLSGSPNPGPPIINDVSPRPQSHLTRQSFHGSRRGGSLYINDKKETPNFLDVPTITKTNWDQQDPRGPIRSRSLHGRPKDYKQDHPKMQFSEY